MRVSLNEIVGMLADRVGQPFNIPLQEELKLIVNYKRADWFQKVLDKHPEQRKFFTRDFSAELQEAEEGECPIETGCTILRTVFKIPLPVRSIHSMFDYVGDPDKSDAYTYTSPDQLYWILAYGSKYTKEKPRYFYINGYIFIYNEDDLEYINVRGVWTDPRSLSDFKCGEIPCYTDDDQYEVPDDIINTMIQDILKNELRVLMGSDDSKVELDKDGTQGAQ